MKKSQTYFLLIFCLFIISANYGHSQTKSYANLTPFIVKIGTYSVPADNVIIKDSSANNKMIYTVVFHLKLKVMDELKGILGELQSSLANNKPVSISLYRVDFDSKVVEERVYDAANVETMELSELDGGAKSEARIRIKIRSSVLQILPGSDKKMPLFDNRKGAAVLACNFKLQLGELPCKYLVNVSFLNLTAEGKPCDFILETALMDAKEWHKWLMEASKGSQKKLDGSLLLLAPDFSNTLFEIKLKEVQMTLYHENFNPTTLPRVKIGLRAGSISMVLPHKK